MENNLDKEKIASKIYNLLEEWAMMLVDPSDSAKDNFDNSEQFYIATIKFKGEKSGSCRAVCQEAFAQTLARNLLGLDDAVENSQTEDALKEMVNVLAGNLLTENYGDTKVFELSTPIVAKVASTEVESLLENESYQYLADCEPVVVTFEQNS